MDQIVTILTTAVLSVGGVGLIISAVVKFSSNLLADKYVEKMKASHLEELENHKNELVSKSDGVARKKQLYENLIMSMRVFLPPSDFDLVENQAVKNSMKREFLINYDKCLLWASDKVIEKLNEYILLQKMQAKDETSVAQEMLKKKHTECFLEMRKDCGFADTKIGMDAYQFVTF